MRCTWPSYTLTPAESQLGASYEGEPSEDQENHLPSPMKPLTHRLLSHINAIALSHLWGGLPGFGVVCYVTSLK